MSNAIPVDEIVGLLATYDPSRLASLKSSYPDRPDLFKIGIVAGPKDESAIKIKAEIALAGMQVIVTTGSAHLKKLQHRLSLGHNFKLLAQILTILASSAVLALLKSQAPPADQYVAATVGVISAILSLLSDSFSRSRVSKMSLEQMYLVLVKQQTTAEQIVEELGYSLRTEHFQRVEALVRKANVCSAAIKEVLLTT